METIVSIKPTLIIRKGRIRVLVSGLSSPVATALLRSTTREVPVTVAEIVENRVILDCDVSIEDDAIEEFAIHLFAADGNELVEPASIDVAGPDFNGE
jgi:hypothetical protein